MVYKHDRGGGDQHSGADVWREGTHGPGRGGGGIGGKGK